MFQTFSRWDRRVFYLCALLLVLNALWIYLNNAPPSWDAANHTTTTFVIAQKIRELDFIKILKVSNYYPVFVQTASALLVLIFGPSIKLVQFTGSIFLVIGVFVLYKYVLLLTKNKRMAFVSSFVFVCFPIIFNESKRMMLDIPLTTLFILSLFFLHKSQKFTNRLFTILFFATISFLLLTKWTGVVFITVPIVSTLFAILINGIRRRQVMNIAIGTTLCLLISSPWYVLNFQSLRDLSVINLIGENTDPISILSVENGVYYLKMLINYVGTLPIILSFFVSSIFLLFKREKNVRMHLLLILFPYLFFTAVSNKDPRYIMPLAPIIAYIVAYFIEILLSSRNKFNNVLSVSLLLTFSIYFSVLTLRPSPIEGAILPIKIPAVGWVNIYDVSDSVSTRLETAIWPIESIFEDINPTQKTVVVIYESERFNPSTLAMYLSQEQTRNNYLGGVVITPDAASLIYSFQEPKFPSTKAIVSYLKNADYVIFSKNSTGVEYARNKKALEQIREYITENFCEKYEGVILGQGSVCIVPEGITLKTSSDILVNGNLRQEGDKEVVGLATVTCPWGCSFTSATKELNTHLNFTEDKSYRLPNGEEISVYKRSD